VNIAINDRKESDKVLSDTGVIAIVAFVVSGDYESALGFRARAMAARLSENYNVQIVYRSRRKIISILKIFSFLVRVRPLASYVFDISYTGVVASGLYKFMFGNCLVIETGDAIVELARSMGGRGRVGLGLTKLLEKIAFHVADRIVVRGTFHQKLLSRQGIDAVLIQDGVDTDGFMPEDVSDLRKQYGLEGVMTVGLIGSSIWSEKLQMCYGWDLVEVIRLLKDRPLKGIMIGGGSGIAHLKALCREYGIADKIVFLGQVSYEQLNRYLQLIDICLSTQTNDIVGKVRTTGKLPLYLAAGRYILASNVGEAALVLEKEMLVDYEGVKDQGYPRKLKERIEDILEHPETLTCAAKNVTLASEHFDYAVLAPRMKQVIAATIEKGSGRKHSH
jgi:glycosyltransferase involved in cell wall biosynthesis